MTEKSRLTKPQRELLESIIHRGYNKKRIADELCISEFAIKARLSCIYARLNVTNLVDAAIRALCTNEVTLPAKGEEDETIPASSC